MPRVLKSSQFTVDENNRVKIDVLDQTIKDARPFKTERRKNNTGATVETMLEQATRGCDLMLSNAETKAARIISDATVKAQELSEEMFQTAKNEGYDVGYDEGYTLSMALKEEAEDIRASAFVEYDAKLNSLEDDILTLIVKIVNKLLTNTIDINKGTIMVLIKAGLSGTIANGDIKIRVSEEDYETVIAQKDDIERQTKSSDKIEIVKDLSLKPCDCIIETPFGNIDCSLERQLSELIENLYYVKTNVDNTELGE